MIYDTNRSKNPAKNMQLKKVNVADPISFSAVLAYTNALKESIKNQTEFHILASPTPSKVRTDEIFTSLLMQHGRKPVEDHGMERKERLRQYGQVSGKPVKQCQEIFTSATDRNKETNPKSVLVTGKAGIGKTLFCQDLIRDWADDKLFKSQTNAQVPDFKFAYLLTFRQLNELRDERFTLMEILNRSSVLEDHSNIDDSLFEYIVDHPEEVLIIIDGYDEFSQQDFITSRLHESYPNNAKEKMPVAALCAKLIKRKILRGSVVMITSRPDECDKMKSKIPFDRYVEITGFSEQKVKEYIEKYFKEKETMKNTVIDHITKNDNLVSFAHIPVLCFLMCYYFEDILNKSMNTDALPVQASDLYCEVVNTFLKEHDRKEGIPPKDTLDKLSELAAQFLLEKKFLFVEEDLKMFTSEEVENLKGSGLLHCGPPFKKSCSEMTKYFCFTHLTLQEYLAARWFVKRRQTVPSSQRRLPPAEMDGQTAPSSQNVSAMVLQFMSGILSQQDGKALMEELLDGIPSSNNLLIATCLTEYRDKEFAKYIVKKRCSKFCNRDGEIEFKDLTDVDCISVSFLLDVISTLNAEETAGKSQTSFQQSSLPLVNRLSLDSCYFTQTGLRRICKVLDKEPCTITDLCLIDCRLNDECADKIGELLPLSKLTQLSLSDIQITDAGVASLRQALQTPTCKITTLDLGGNEITDASVGSLCQALQSPTCKVTKLDLCHNQITDAGVASLCQALERPTCKITTLDLGDNEITDAGVGSLCQALQSPTCKVTKLDLCKNQIADAGGFSLCQALQARTCKVTTLHLSGNQITDAGVVSLCQALQAPRCKVTTLDLSANQITDTGVVSLCHTLQTPRCKVISLGLSGNQITDTGVVSLCQALQTRTCKVTKLYLADNQITNAGVVRLCQALKTPRCKVISLVLCGNLITDAGVGSLCQALQTSTCKVTTLSLRDNRITNAGKERLRNLLEQRPHLDLEY